MGIDLEELLSRGLQKGKLGRKILSTQQKGQASEERSEHVSELDSSRQDGEPVKNIYQDELENDPEPDSNCLGLQNDIPAEFNIDNEDFPALSGSSTAGPPLTDDKQEIEPSVFSCQDEEPVKNIYQDELENDPEPGSNFLAPHSSIPNNVPAEFNIDNNDLPALPGSSTAGPPVIDDKQEIGPSVFSCQDEEPVKNMYQDELENDLKPDSNCLDLYNDIPAEFNINNEYLPALLGNSTAGPPLIDNKQQIGPFSYFSRQDEGQVKSIDQDELENDPEPGSNSSALHSNIPSNIPTEFNIDNEDFPPLPGSSTAGPPVVDGIQEIGPSAVEDEDQTGPLAADDQEQTVSLNKSFHSYLKLSKSF